MMNQTPTIKPPVEKPNSNNSNKPADELNINKTPNEKSNVMLTFTCVACVLACSIHVYLCDNYMLTCVYVACVLVQDILQKNNNNYELSQQYQKTDNELTSYELNSNIARKEGVGSLVKKYRKKLPMNLPMSPTQTMPISLSMSPTQAMPENLPMILPMSPTQAVPISLSMSLPMSPTQAMTENLLACSFQVYARYVRVRTCADDSCLLALSMHANLQKWMKQRLDNTDLISFDDAVQFPELEEALIMDMMKKGVKKGLYLDVVSCT